MEETVRTGGCDDVPVDHDEAGHLERWLCVLWRANPTTLRRGTGRQFKMMVYLHGTKFMGLTFVRGSGLDLTAYNDGDSDNKSNDRRSVSGTVITLGGAAVSWASSTQSCVALSTASAEYVALGEGSFVYGRSVVVYSSRAKRILRPGFRE